MTHADFLWLETQKMAKKIQKKGDSKRPIKKALKIRNEVSVSEKSYYPNWLMEYHLKEKREKQREKKFKGITLAKYYNGTILKNEFGECYKISVKVEVNTPNPNKEKVKKSLQSDIKIIPGISHITEKNLKRNGITSITKLQGHYRFRHDATKYLGHIENNSVKEIYSHLSSRVTSTNLLLLHNSALFNLSEIAFIDIETLGLTECPLFLVGIATFNENHLIIDQIFVRQLKEEKPALSFLIEHLREKKAIITFNGKCFDIPFIHKRMQRFDLKHEITHPHFDLRWLSKKGFGDAIGSSLSDIEEEIFNMERKEDVTGDEIPSYYMKYLRSKNIGSIVPIIDHNRQDLISSVKIFVKLCELYCC